MFNVDMRRNWPFGSEVLTGAYFINLKQLGLVTLGVPQYASFNAIYTNCFISKLRCNLLSDLRFRGEARTFIDFC